MEISAQDLKTLRQWRAAVGCDTHHFDELLVVFRQTYAALHQGQPVDRTVIHLGGTCMNDEADLLFLTLFSCKSGLTYDVLGLVCGMDAATAKRRQEERLAAVREALRLANCLPERDFHSPAELQRYFSKRRAVSSDATGVSCATTAGKNSATSAVQRQKERHTLKAFVLADAQRKLIYVGRVVPGSVHDFAPVKKQLPPENPWLTGWTVRAAGRATHEK